MDSTGCRRSRASPGFLFAGRVMGAFSYKIGFQSKKGTKRKPVVTLSVRITRGGVEIAKYQKGCTGLIVAVGFAWGGFAGCRLEGGTLTRPHPTTNTVTHFRFFQDGKWLTTDAIAPALKEASKRRAERVRKERELIRRLDAIGGRP